MTLIKNQSLPDRAMDAVMEGMFLPFKRVFGDHVVVRIAAIVVFFPLFLGYTLLVVLPVVVVCGPWALVIKLREP